MIELRVNNEAHQLDIDPQMPLLWELHEHVGLTGAKYGCGIGQCGACTVRLGTAAVRSRALPVSAAAGQEITTIEGLADGPNGAAGRAIQQAWQDIDVVHCGFCRSGQIMQAAALLASAPNPDDAAIDTNMSGNICRCATYVRIRKAFHSAAKALA
jgi:isoquinoline 1-oxidoreductase alpha subunit